MNPLINIESFMSENAPYGFYHKIYFKQSSSSFTDYGNWIYGRFIKVESKFHKKVTENKFLKISAPKINGYNNNLREGVTSMLSYKGINFEHIDIEATYPGVIA